MAKVKSDGHIQGLEFKHKVKHDGYIWDLEFNWYVCFLFRGNFDNFWLWYSKFYIWPWKFKVKVMTKINQNLVR